MRQSIRYMWWSGLMVVVLGFAADAGLAAETGYRQVVDGVAVYFGIVPAQLVRGHPKEHPEGEMHGGAPAGENHIMVALFEEKTGKRVDGAVVTVTVTGPGRSKAEKNLEPMTVAGAASYGHYFYMPGAGPYRIALRIRLPGEHKELRANFTWARS